MWVVDPAANQLWTDFLAVWPKERLSSMTLAEYSQSGRQDTLTYWLESKTEQLGSIWGGSAFKFGIYNRASKEVKARDRGLVFANDYGWYEKYGATADEAFQTVRGILVKIADAAARLDLEAIESIAFSRAIKWKLAFLYQDRRSPLIIPAYKRERLEAFARASGIPVGEQAAIYRAIRQRHPQKDILELGAEVWNASQPALAGQGFPIEMAERFLEDRYGYRVPPTKKIAAFETDGGRQLAVPREGTSVRVILEPPLPALAGLGEAETYPPERTRHSNLTSQAPNVATGRPAVQVTVPNAAMLEKLCELYENAAYAVGEPQQPIRLAEEPMARIPLNVILYGPPGTGKTHATVTKALEILAPDFLATNRAQRGTLTERFRQLRAAGRIRFVTFHQSFSYEDFVEGIRATKDDDGQLLYRVEDGIFKTLCNAASAKVTGGTAARVDIAGKAIWKMSLGDTQGDETEIYDECIKNGYVLLGFGRGLDYTGCKSVEDVRARQSPSTKPMSDHSAKAVYRFVAEMKVGDLVVVSDGNLRFRAIGEIRGAYRHLDRPGEHYDQCRDVTWHRVYQPSLPWEQLMSNRFTQKTLYRLGPDSIDLQKLAALLGTSVASDKGPTFRRGESIGGYEVREETGELLHLTKPNGANLSFDLRLLNELADYVRAGKVTLSDIRDKQVYAKVPESRLERYMVGGYASVLANIVERIVASSSTEAVEGSKESDAWVLIIDEINRGNISKIFGELITLIEPSRRAGAREALSVQLPYSRDEFAVPDNVYVIGTMNTADRSLAGLDIALRRRFIFEEMAPDPALLDGIAVEGLPIGDMLKVLNSRIEALRDADHCLGHSYFLDLRVDPTLKKLSAIFRGQIVPLLQEYFFDDWERIRWVLNDHAKVSAAHQFVCRPEGDMTKLFGSTVAPQIEERRWRLNEPAFEQIESYRGILGAAA
jgi:5-methylcytosine-specific restriction enzyme B